MKGKNEFISQSSMITGGAQVLVRRVPAVAKAGMAS